MNPANLQARANPQAIDWNDLHDAELHALFDHALIADAPSGLERMVQQSTQPELARLAEEAALSLRATDPRWDALLDEALDVEGPAGLEWAVLRATRPGLRTLAASSRARQMRWGVQMDHLLDEALATSTAGAEVEEMEVGMVGAIRPRTRSAWPRWADFAFGVAATIFFAIGAGVVLATWDFGQPYQPLDHIASNTPTPAPAASTPTPRERTTQPVSLARVDAQFDELRPAVPRARIDNAIDSFQVELAVTEASIIAPVEPWEDEYLAIVYEMDLLTSELRRLYY